MASPTVKSKKSLKRAKSVMSRSVGSELVRRLGKFVDALESLPPTADLGTRFTCRTVRLNLDPPTCSPKMVRQTRELLGASQAIFSQFLGVSASTLQDWEQGHKPPRGSACRLMEEIRRDPEYWQRRMQELAVPSAG